MVVGAPLEDARRHAQRYDRVRQEAESQVNKTCTLYAENITTSAYLFINF